MHCLLSQRMTLFWKQFSCSGDFLSNLISPSMVLPRLGYLESQPFCVFWKEGTFLPLDCHVYTIQKLLKKFKSIALSSSKDVFEAIKMSSIKQLVNGISFSSEFIVFWNLRHIAHSVESR